MLPAAARVGGSPMARTKYGGLRVWPSTDSAPGLPTTQVSTPTRTAGWPWEPRISIASAPAARSSVMTSIIVSGDPPPTVAPIVRVMPGPVAATVPTRIDSAASRACASAIAAWSSDPEVFSAASVRCRSATSLFSDASRCCSESSSTTRSAGRADSSASPVAVRLTCVAMATPSTTHRTTASTPNDVGRRSIPNVLRGWTSPIFGGVASGGSSWRPWCAESGSCAFICSRSEQLAPQGRGVPEDPDAQHDDDCGRQLRAYAELIPEVHDQGGDQDIEHKRYDEDLGVEDPVKVRAQAAEHRVERRHHGDRQVRLHHFRHAGMKHQPQYDAHDQRRDTDHASPPTLIGAVSSSRKRSSVPFPLRASAHRSPIGLAYFTSRPPPAGTVNESCAVTGAATP